jgi:hypothetical protein
MKKIIIILVFIIFVVAFYICINHKTEIFTNSQCEAPCWNNIEPGFTTRDEALAILQQDSSIDGDSIQSLVLHDNQISEMIIFNIRDGFQITALGRLYFIDDVVEFISFEYPLSISLGEAFDSFGEPESLFLSRDPDLNINFLYPSTGIILLYVIHEPNLNEYVIQQNDIIEGVLFFNPNLYEQIIEDGFIPGISEATLTFEEFSSQLLPWNGYGSLNNLYPSFTP